MDYASTLEKIFHCYPMYHKVGSSAYKEGLENIEQLLALIGHPEKKFKAVHVAGTNGKGSVSHLLASFCKEAGLKTGLYTSPHLLDFRERIRIDGKNISEKETLQFFEQYGAKIKCIEPSFFEITTAIAFDYFAKSKVDIAVIEVGLGGRLDATNVISPLLSVITNISLEHTALLGDTIAKIAYEKAGIIKENTPVVIGEFHPESFPVFEKIAKERQAPLLLADRNFSVHFQNENPESDGTRTLCIDKDTSLHQLLLKSPLTGNYQTKNITTFIAAASQLTKLLKLSDTFIRPAIENIQNNFTLMGRWQIVNKHPLTICDTGHNFGCLSETMPQLKSLKYNKLYIIIGFVNDKDLDAIFPILPTDATYITCTASVERALPAEILTEQISQKGFNATNGGSVAEAYEKVHQVADSDDVIFVGGSTFIVADFLKINH
ncbi:MAG: bifunctional folylpolyglutamate synthase/dihydrofolate synthase [Bacteroidales bacterium]|nr:bifunctional folylpolyglutamate synthase/dihydrofolate synthase [Bacteroidales bacterium]